MERQLRLFLVFNFHRCVNHVVKKIPSKFEVLCVVLLVYYSNKFFIPNGEVVVVVLSYALFGMNFDAVISVYCLSAQIQAPAKLFSRCKYEIHFYGEEKCI